MSRAITDEEELLGPDPGGFSGSSPSLVDGAIGEGSKFHETYGIYGQGVGLTTAVLPVGWRGRLVPFTRDDAVPAQAVCHSLAARFRLGPLDLSV